MRSKQKRVKLKGKVTTDIEKWANRPHGQSMSLIIRKAKHGITKEKDQGSKTESKEERKRERRERE